MSSCCDIFFLLEDLSCCPLVLDALTMQISERDLGHWPLTMSIQGHRYGMYVRFVNICLFGHMTLNVAMSYNKLVSCDPVM